MADDRMARGGDVRAGYQEIEHTADWALEIWAPTLPGLLLEGMRGMYELSGARFEDGAVRERAIELEAVDAEDLLVTFLGELLFWTEIEREGFVGAQITLDDHPGEQCRLQATLHGQPIVSQSKEIKAVTYHDLAIEHREQGLWARVVFDV